LPDFTAGRTGMAIDFSFRDFWYPLRLHRMRRLFERSPYWPRLEMREYQSRRLATVVLQASRNVPHYRRLFASLGLTASDIRDVEDLKKLPLLSREELRSGSRDFLAADAERYSPRIYSTGGTTGSPLEIRLDRDARVLEFVYYWRHWSWAGYRLGDPFAELGSLFFLSRNDRNDKIFQGQPHLGRLMINSAKVGFSNAEKMAGAIRNWHAEFLKGTASALYFLALSFREKGINDVAFRAIFSTGEVLTPAYRMLIERVFGCRVLDSYGHMEGTVAVSECPDGGYHINEDYGILELESVRTLADGRVMARAVGTSLYNLAMPLLRYDVGDEIELFPCEKPCPCGRRFPLVKAIHGRSEDVVVTPDGRFITSMFVVPEFSEGVRSVQFVQEETDRLLVRVVPGEEWGPDRRGVLFENVRKLVGTEMKLEMEEIAQEALRTDASGKIRTVISRVRVG